MSTANPESESTRILSLRNLPPWLMSMTFHLSMLIIVGLLHFKVIEVTETPAIGLNFNSDGDGAGEFDLGTSDGGQLGNALTPGEAPASDQLTEQLATAESHLDQMLTTTTSLDSNLLSSLESDLRKSAAKSSTKPPARGGNGKSVGDGDGSQAGRASMFNIEGYGHKFVYVFDRSDSMNYRYYSQENTAVYSIPLIAAKDELLASINELTSKQQFNVVFYNHQPELYDGERGPQRKSFATPRNKQRAMEYIYSLRAEGGTNTMNALDMALRLHPDVVFLLTDGEAKDDPAISDLKRIQALNRYKAAIHVIQFAKEDRPDSTLITLAEQNRGKHIFIDITRTGDYARKIGAQLRREIGAQLKQPK